MQAYSNSAIDTSGNAVSGASALVTLKDSATHATIYSDNAITTTANPLTTDSNGLIFFYAANGTYDIVITSGLTTVTIEDVTLFDPFAQGTADTAQVHRNVQVTTELTTPTAAPGSPAAGDVWEASGNLTHGASSVVVMDLSRTQTVSGAKTFSAAITSTVSGAAPFVVDAASTVVTNLIADKGDSATSFFSAGNLELARLPLGTANQMLGMNSGASAQEHKTLATGSTGTDFTIAHSTNTVTFNFPTASGANRGLLASADWTTFNSGAVSLGRLPVGTANQILGTDSGATTVEQKTLSIGTSGTDFALAHSANAIAFNLPDAGASARGAVTTGTQTLAGAKTFSGILTTSGGQSFTGRSIFSCIPIGSVAYASLGTSTTPVAGTIYIAEIFIPRNFTLTGIAVLNAATVGTNLWNVALYTSAGGAAVANSALTGVLTAGANAFQLIPFTGTYSAIGPARFWIAAQMNGTTDRFRTIAASTFVDTFTKSFAGAFGTMGSLTVPTSFTADVGIIGYVY